MAERARERERERERKRRRRTGREIRGNKNLHDGMALTVLIEPHLVRVQHVVLLHVCRQPVERCLFACLAVDQNFAA